MKTVTPERLKEVLRYAPETGVLTWRVRKANRTRIGSQAGHMVGKYMRIEIDGTTHSVSSVAWAIMTGHWPTSQVDHKDLNQTNNRWGNLRAATVSQNCANRRKRSNNTSGVKGVHQLKTNGLWRARIGVNGTRRLLGDFVEKDQAAAAYAKAANDLFGEFARIS